MEKGREAEGNGEREGERPRGLMEKGRPRGLMEKKREVGRVKRIDY